MHRGVIGASVHLVRASMKECLISDIQQSRVPVFVLLDRKTRFRLWESGFSYITGVEPAVCPKQDSIAAALLKWFSPIVLGISQSDKENCLNRHIFWPHP